MPRRSTPRAAPVRPGAPAKPAPAEPEPFAPAEPWWRQSRRGPVTPRGQKESAAPRFEIAAPRIVTREEPPALARPHISGAAVAAAVVMFAFVAGLGFVVTTDWLAVTRASTEIRGAARLTEDAIYAASQLEGVNIFQVHPGRVAERLAQLPGITEAAVRPRLPYLVTIVVREETPFVVWQGITTTTWLAENGAAVPAIGAPPLLKLTDPAGVATEGPRQQQVLADLRALRAAGLEETELYYGAQEGLYFRSRDGWTVYLGNEGPMDIKLAALRTIKNSKAAETARARIIDLRGHFKPSGRAQVW